MKKILIPLLAIFLLLGCEPSQEVLDTKQIYYFDLQASDWAEGTDTYGLNRYYFSEQKIRGLNYDVYDKGGVMVYLLGDGFQQVLPSTRYYENKNGERWARTIDYDFSKRTITFYVTNSDFAQAPPESMSFRVVLIW